MQRLEFSGAVQPL